MSFTTDPTTYLGIMRVLIGDTDPNNVIFQDDSLTAFYVLEGSVKRASAQALDAIAVNELLSQKVVRILGLSVDGAKVAETLHKLAESFRAQADYDESTTANFDIAEFVLDNFSVAERINNQRLRTGL